MKISWLIAILTGAALFSAPGQTTTPPTATDPMVAGTPWIITSRNANQRIWQRITYEITPDGRSVPHLHRVVELATGLCRQDGKGNWVDSDETISILSDGTAAATNCEHQVHFPGDIAEGVITLVTPDGKQLQSRPIGLSYDDGTKTVLIAVLTNSVGELVGSNRVVYPNAFEGAAGSLRYTCTKAGFEQDIVVQGQLPTPESYDLNPATTRLQVLTEFFDTSDPEQTLAPANPQSGLRDAILTFGTMKMNRGRAFSINGTNQSDFPIGGTPTFKSWLHLSGRKFLIEEVPYVRVAPQLKQLPASARTNSRRDNTNLALNKVSTRRLLPPVRLALADDKRVQVAKADPSRPRSLVLDYFSVNSGQTNFTFQGNMTYYVSGYYNLYGTTIFEGGTVIKYGPSGTIEVDGPYVCQTGPYRPAVFTSMNDNSVGETISGSSGTPGSTDSPWDLYITSTGGVLSNMRFSYTMRGVAQQGLNVWDCQFVNCNGFGLDELGSTGYVHNVLFANCYYFAVIQDVYNGMTLIGEHITADQCGALVNSGSAAYVTNSLFTGMGTSLPPSANNPTVVVLSTNTGIYQPVGAGSYYLATNSPYHGYGTPNINSALLAELQQKTTYPPTVYSNQTFSVPRTFSPQIPRDTNDLPDIGYHYDPIDYFFGGVTAYSNLTFTAGTAFGWFELPGSGGPGYGISLANDVTATFTGTVTSPCVFARYDTVQEGGNGLWKDKGWLAGMEDGGSYDPNSPAVVTATFTHFFHLAADPNHLRDGTVGQPLVIRATHSEFYGAFGGYNILGGYTNCLFYRGGTGISTSSSYDYQIFRNCTFYGGLLNFGHWESGPPYWYSSVRDCAFDGTTFGIDDPFGTNSNYADYDYNAFDLGAAQLPTEGTNTITVINGFNWQSSWLGSCYLPSVSALIDAGDRTADQIGLYHFTTQTNQTIEGFSTVDIGYHCVATDAYGNPLDSNGDGIPDYLEDANGNGIYDSGDIAAWNATVNGIVPAAWYNSYGLDSQNPLIGIQDADWDGLLNQQEYLYGTNPNILEGFGVWISTPNGTSSIP